MELNFMRAGRLVAALGGTAVLCIVPVAQAPGAARSAAPERARMAFSHALPRLDGAHLDAKLVEVTYGPGESSSPHTHPCPIVGYVLEGTVRMRVAGSPEAVYKAGQAFYEEANVNHIVSANASHTRRARFLAFFVCDHEAPLSTEVHDGAH
jgi:quercetin dioxygenase-like cupin family protein